MRRKTLTRRQAKAAGQIDLSLPPPPPPPASYEDLVLSARRRGAFGTAPQPYLYNTAAELTDRRGIVGPLRIPAPSVRGWAVWNRWREFCVTQQREYHVRMAEAGAEHGTHMPFPDLPGARCNDAGLRYLAYVREHGHSPPPPKTIRCEHTGRMCSRDRGHDAGVVHLARYLSVEAQSPMLFPLVEPIQRATRSACCVRGLAAIARHYEQEMSGPDAWWVAEIKVDERLHVELDELLAHDPCWVGAA